MLHARKMSPIIIIINVKLFDSQSPAWLALPRSPSSISCQLCSFAAPTVFSFLYTPCSFFYRTFALVILLETSTTPHVFFHYFIFNSFIESILIYKELHLFNVYNLMSLDICKHLWYHHKKVIYPSNTSQNFLVFFHFCFVVRTQREIHLLKFWTAQNVLSALGTVLYCSSLEFMLLVFYLKKNLC